MDLVLMSNFSLLLYSVTLTTSMYH